jgi:hypothetical protein
MYATTGVSLVQFDSLSPNDTTVPVAFSGLQAGESIVGIDLRPADGLLYGVGSSSRLYTINPLTGAATQVGMSGAFTLSGSSFGVDFNPVVDRLRVVSDAEQNIRLRPDGTLAATDTALNPAGNVVAIAYSNNFVGATSTTLYSIDSASGNLGIITVPNNGGPITTVGSLGLSNLSSGIGFDISGLTGIAYACLSFFNPLATTPDGNISSLYRIDLATGTATFIGDIGAGSGYIGLTAATAIPEPSSFLLFGAAAAGLLGYKRLRRAKS